MGLEIRLSHFSTANLAIANEPRMKEAKARDDLKKAAALAKQSNNEGDNDHSGAKVFPSGNE